MATTTCKAALEQLEALGDEKVRAQNRRQGAEAQQFGVRLGDIRKLAKTIQSDHALGLALWETKNVDGRLLAILLMKPKQLSPADLGRMVRSVDSVQVADWFNAYVVAKHPDKEALREPWMADENRWAARAGWSLTYDRLTKSPEGLDPAALLDRLESELSSAAPEVQWTMNFSLAAIGIHVPKLRKRAIALGEELGLYRDYPVSKGCTSPFAPIWIREMVKRQG